MPVKTVIEVRPTPALRRDFARWAVAQTPKVRTVSPQSFAVPASLFTGMPEELLIGALVDGHRYRSPDEDAMVGTPPPGTELLGVATHVGLTPATGDPAADAAAMVAATSPEAIQAPMTAVVTAADLAASNTDSGNLPEPDDAPDGVFPCPECEREFTTERGRDTHRRQAHREG